MISGYVQIRIKCPFCKIWEMYRVPLFDLAANESPNPSGLDLAANVGKTAAVEHFCQVAGGRVRIEIHREIRVRANRAVLPNGDSVMMRV